MVVTAVMLGSVVQFHHHSSSGEIHVYDLLIDVETAVADNSGHNAGNDCCNGTSNKSTEKKDCSLKLSISKPYTEKNNILPLIPWLAILAGCLIDISPILTSNNAGTRHWHLNLITGLFKPGCIGLRSPPQQD